jgi:Uma2 family endonuclease
MVCAHMNAQEFFQLPETNLPTELIEGELIEMPAHHDQHQKTSIDLVMVLFPVLPPGEFRCAPTDVYLDDSNVFQPDLFWVSADNTNCRLQNGRWYDAPDLVIEIISPATARRDRKTKFDTYQKYGVREYWMIDPVAKYFEVWVRVMDIAKFVYLGVFGPAETFNSPVLADKTVNVSAVFQ